MTISVKQNNSYAAATGVWVKVNGVWKQVATSGLDGLGGWATITAVSGSPKRYAYKDGIDWVAFEWGTAGEFSCRTTAGILDALIVSGGGAGSSNSDHAPYGTCGRVNEGLIEVTADDHIVQVGEGGKWATLNGRSYPSFFASHVATFVGYGQPTYGSAAVDPTITITLDGMKSSITGTEQEYAPGNYSTQTHGHVYGQPGRETGRDGFNGVVIVRVPAAQAAGVDPGSWVTRIDYYAEVTDGIVTDLYQERFYGDGSVRTENGRFASPEQPDDLIPCDPSVAEGWTYADGEFTPPPPPPPPTREELIEALQEQLKDLQKDQ